MGEGQFRVDDADHATLNDLDDSVVEAVEGADPVAYQERFAELLAFVRSKGETLAADDLQGSDFLLPPADTTFAEAGEEFSGEGLIPDPA